MNFTRHEGRNPKITKKWLIYFGNWGWGIRWPVSLRIPFIEKKPTRRKEGDA